MDSSPPPTAAPQWIDCKAWELDLYGLPHRIPWPADSDPKLAEESPFDAGLLLNAIEDLGPDAGPPWTSFFQAAEHFDELAEALEDNEFPTARRLLDEIERVHPGTIFTQFHRAHVARYDGRVEEAIALYRAVAERVPRYGFVWVNLGATLASEGRRDEAVAAFLNAVRINQNDTHALEGLAALRAAVKVQRDPKDPKSAAYLDLPTFGRMALRQIPQLATNPDHLQAFGEQLLRDGFAPPVAVQALEKCRELRPDDPRTLMALAAAYRHAGRPHEARAIAVRITEVRPDDAEAWLHLAQTEHASGNAEAARAALDRTLALDPNLQPAIALRFGVTDAADTAAEARVMAFGEEREAWMPFLIASAMARDRADLSIAVRYAERAYDFAPGQEEVLLQLCALLGQSKDAVRLIEVIEPCIASGEFSRRLHWNYAQALKSAGRVSEGVNVLIGAASAEDAPEDFKQAAASTIDFWNGLLAESGITVETLKAGSLARPVLLRLDDGDGAVLLHAGHPLPVEGKFPWRVPPDGRAETRIHLQQGQTGSSVEPRDLGCFLVRGLPPVTSGAHTLQCQIAAGPQATLIFRAMLGNRELRVTWEAPVGAV
jgi:tetratricopeptide (TPR) repeat protein